MKQVKPQVVVRFTAAELQAMHRYCLKYSEIVRSGKTPTPEQSRNFMLFHRVYYSEGDTNAR